MIARENWEVLVYWIKEETNQAEHLFKLGVHQQSAGYFKESVQTLEQVAKLFLKESNYKRYFQIQLSLIAMHAEMENFDEIAQIRKHLVDFVWKQKELSKDSTIFHYLLGMCYLKQRKSDTAQQHFNQALAQSIQLQKVAQEHGDKIQLLNIKINLCFISYGFINLLYQKEDQMPAAVQELNNMGELLEQCKALDTELKLKRLEPSPATASLSQVLKSSKEEVQKLELAYLLLKANILRKEKKYNSAEQMYWVCYELSQKSLEKKYLAAFLFYFMGSNYMAKADYEQASIFLNLAKKSIQPEVFKKLYKNIGQALGKLKENIISYDIVVNFNNKLLVEKQKGSVNFKNQFILLDMLRLFVTNPGTVYSKEALVEKVWKQKYDPCVHDNKIYVTVKRLRELVEPDYSNPKYIFRKKEGYYFDKTVKILLK